MNDEHHLPTIAAKVKAHDKALFGTDGNNGLNGRVKNLESAVYRDTRTNAPGLVPRMDRIERILWAVVLLLVVQLLGLDGLINLVTRWAGG